MSKPSEIIAAYGGMEGFLQGMQELHSRTGKVFHTAGHYDAKTLIRHAMQTLQDQMGINDAERFNADLRNIFFEIRAWEQCNLAPHKQVQESVPTEENEPIDVPTL